MHFSQAIFATAIFACFMATAMAVFDPLTLTVGSTAYVLTSSQVAIAAASIAGLAIAKEALLIAAISRSRSGGRSSRRGRSAEDNEILQTPLLFAEYFDSIAKSDVYDCGKLLVCHAMAKNENSLTNEEKLVTKLFDDLEHINPNTGYAEYQLAAYVGTFKQPEVCVARYSRCPNTPESLGSLIKVN